MTPRSGLRFAGGVLVFCLVACDQGQSGKEVPTASAPAVTPPPLAVGSAFPALRLELVDGGDYELASQRGNWVVVNFWATWCTPCLKEMPELSALHDAHENVNVVGLAYEEIEPVKLQQVLATRPVSYPVAIVDPYAMPPGIAAPRGLPVTYLIDPQGSIAREYLGPVTRADIERAIQAQ